MKLRLTIYQTKPETQLITNMYGLSSINLELVPQGAILGPLSIVSVLCYFVNRVAGNTTTDTSWSCVSNSGYVIF